MSSDSYLNWIICFSIGGTLSNLFWAIFGIIDISIFEVAEIRFKTTEYTAKFLFGLFLISVVLVSLNMLIAMMNNTFNKVDVRTTSSLCFVFSSSELAAQIVSGQC